MSCVTRELEGVRIRKVTHVSFSRVTSSFLLSGHWRSRLHLLLKLLKLRLLLGSQFVF